MATIDVLVPVFNAERTVEAALRSILAQTFDDLRIIVVDDGSTDGTSAILARLVASDPRMEVVTTPNGGIVDALNAALERSSAPFIARHDADDIAYPDRLAKQLALLRAEPDVVAVGCNVHYIDDAGRRTGGTSRFEKRVHSDPFYAPAIEPYLIHPFLLARRDALVGIGGYRYSFHTEDADLYWRLADAGRLTNLVDVLGEYRIHAGSVSARSIVNGRIAAVTSQLAAISEQRRRHRLPDLAFPKSALAAYQAAGSLENILGVAAEGLTVDERAYLEIGSAAKLVELANYRPYRLTRADRRTVRRCIEQHYHALPQPNRRHMVFRLIPTRERLTRRPLETLGLLPWRRMPAAFVELIRFQIRRTWRPRAS